MRFILERFESPVVLNATQVSQLAEMLIGADVLESKWQSGKDKYLYSIVNKKVSDIFHLRPLTDIEYDALKMQAENGQ